jgi:hypothetical protein
MKQPELTKEDIERLTNEKRQAEADDRDADLNAGWQPEN